MTHMKGELYWAVIHYLRWWLWFDQAELRMVRDANGLDQFAIRRIATTYSVIRGLGDGAGGAAIVDANAGRLATLLNSQLSDWRRSNLAQRHHLCAQLASEAWKGDHNPKGFLRNKQVSAITKLMWFLDPKGWTVFDKLVSKGMNAILDERGVNRRRPSSQTASFRYYDWLQGLGFVEALPHIESALANTALAELPAGRIIDSYFYIAGADHAATERKRAEAFLLGLPAGFRSEVETVALDMALRVPFPRLPGT